MNAAETLNRAWKIHSAGDPRRAETTYREVIAAVPEDASAWCFLGMALYDQGRNAEAVVCYTRSHSLDPRVPQTWNNLGNALVKLKEHTQAADAFRKALALKPDYANAYNGLGNAAAGLGESQKAIEYYERALRLQPGLALAQNGMAAALMSQGNPSRAVEVLQSAIAIDPRYASAMNNMGAAMRRLGRWDEAIEWFRRSIAARPDAPDTHQNLGMTLMIRGDYAGGWPEYDWRLKTLTLPPGWEQKLWDGSRLAGQTVLVFTEQGLGDTLNFVSFCKQVKQAGAGRVVLHSQRLLAPLLARCQGVDEVTDADGPWPAHDLCAPLMSLPLILQKWADTVAAEVPYLTADAGLIETRWRKRLAGLGGTRRVGITWQGSPTYGLDRERSFPIELFEPLARVEGVRLVSLQRGYGSEQLARIKGKFEVADLISPNDPTDPIERTAAIMCALDLMVTSDSMPAHLAGGLGRPVWVALPAAVIDWRWGLAGDRAGWYPTMRLFRQEQPGDWTGVFARIGQALAKG